METLQKRFKNTHELSMVGNSRIGYCSFDFHGESEQSKKRLEPTQVPNSVEMDFSNYFKCGNTSAEKVGYFRESTLSAAEEELTMMEGVTSDDSVTSLRRLKAETTSTAFPSSKMLNIVMRSLLFEETDPSVLRAAHNYLCHFLMLNLHPGSKDRDTWLVLVLSAFRSLEQEKLFKKFDLTNCKDVYSCWFFLKEVVDKMEERAVETRNEEIGEEEKEESLIGPYLLFNFLTKMLEKDYEIWWKEWRRSSEAGSPDLVTYPLLFYIFGGDKKSVMRDLSKSLISLYKCLLRQEHWSLENVRLKYQSGFKSDNLFTRCGEL